MINKKLLITWVVSIIGAYFIGNIVPIKIFALNVDWHKQISAGDLYNYCVNTIQAIGTVGAIIVALFSDNIKNYFRKPKLDISLHSNDLIEELDNCNGARKAKRYHNSVDIFNKGNINAENCEIYIDSILFRGLGMQLQRGAEMMGVHNGHVVNIREIKVIRKLKIFGGGERTIIRTKVWDPLPGKGYVSGPRSFDKIVYINY